MEPSDLSKREITLSVVVLAAVAIAVWWLDASFIVNAGKAGSITANAVGATLAGIGGVLMMLASTRVLGVAKRKWRPNTLAAGGLLVAAGGFLVALSAWQSFFIEFPIPGE